LPSLFLLFRFSSHLFCRWEILVFVLLVVLSWIVHFLVLYFVSLRIEEQLGQIIRVSFRARTPFGGLGMEDDGQPEEECARTMRV
ncbi:hypothetical protein PFISCL1PPCAC_2547, partial [Pristionchus fissidentatus]